MGEDAAFGRKVKGVKIYAEDAVDYVGTLVTRYQRQRGEGESLGTFLSRLDDAELARFAQPEGER
jgi:sulfite reductase (ferredoxin)